MGTADEHSLFRFTDHVGLHPVGSQPGFHPFRSLIGKHADTVVGIGSGIVNKMGLMLLNQLSITFQTVDPVDQHRTLVDQTKMVEALHHRSMSPVSGIFFICTIFR